MLAPLSLFNLEAASCATLQYSQVEVYKHRYFMNQILKLEVSSSILKAVELQAKSKGIKPEQLVAALLEQEFLQTSRSPIENAEREKERVRSEGSPGSLTLGSSIGDSKIVTGEPGSNLIKSVGLIPSDDLHLMKAAINRDCDRIDLDEW